MKTCKCGKPAKSTLCTVCNRKQWRERNPEAYKASRARYRKKRRPPPTRVTYSGVQAWLAKLLRTSRSNAKLNNVSHNLTHAFLVKLYEAQNGRCVLTRAEMTCVPSDPKAVSLDRRDSDFGYTEDNVQLVCSWINIAKKRWSHVTIDELLDEVARLREDRWASYFRSSSLGITHSGKGSSC